ncbi:MAG: hypothetical protein F2663_04765 [Actinobacteria bacterium]|uniref:Unannotated protein n=1 Tax=freshwater metagenome TaxID=449393 RepID=A0A6J6PF44_9ZZZZ|nr:hypothetical protein [Actinomycetota bacterium]
MNGEAIVALVSSFLVAGFVLALFVWAAIQDGEKQGALDDRLDRPYRRWVTLHRRR